MLLTILTKRKKKEAKKKEKNNTNTVNYFQDKTRWHKIIKILLRIYN